jgi:Tfp pilus assembly pilus retraction ATPase PilT
MFATALLLISNSYAGTNPPETLGISRIIETGYQQGMIDMNRSLADLVKAGEITTENAFTYSINPKGLEHLL